MYETSFSKSMQRERGVNENERNHIDDVTLTYRITPTSKGSNKTGGVETHRTDLRWEWGARVVELFETFMNIRVE